MSGSASPDRVLAAIEQGRAGLVDFAAELIRIPTVNPPGENYRECAEFLGARLGAWPLCGHSATRTYSWHGIIHIGRGAPRREPIWPLGVIQ